MMIDGRNNFNFSLTAEILFITKKGNQEVLALTICDQIFYYFSICQPYKYKLFIFYECDKINLYYINKE